MSDNSNDNKVECINLDEVYIRSIVGFMLGDSVFFKQCVRSMTPSNIPFPKVSLLFKVLSEFFAAHDKIPTKEDVLQILHQKYPTVTEYMAYKAELDLCLMARERVTFESLVSQMSGWLHFLVMGKMLKSAAFQFNNKAYGNTHKIIVESINNLKELAFEKDERIRLNNIKSDLDAMKAERQNCCTLGNSDFDEILLKGSKTDGNQQDIKQATTGSLLPGDVTIILGPSNAGKTTTVTTIIASNLLFGKKVLFLTHEERKEKIKIKITQSLLGITAEELYAHDENTMRLHSDAVAQITDKNLYYLEWIKPGKMFAEDVAAMIQEIQDKEVAKTGKGFDLLVNDYPGKLNLRSGSTKNIYEDQKIVYEYFLTLARFNRFHAIVPSQTNRSGYRTAREGSDGKDARMLDQADQGGSFGVMQIADNVITINRSLSDIGAKTIKYHIAKSRSGETGWTFVSKTSFDKSRAFFQNMPSLMLPPGAKMNDEEIQKRLGLVYQGQSAQMEPSFPITDLETESGMSIGSLSKKFNK